MRSLQDYLESDGALGRLSPRARKLVDLDRAYADAAPQLLASASGVARLEAGTLYLWAADGAVAAKLRQLTPMLLSRIRQGAPECHAIRVTVQVCARRTRVAEPVPRNLGAGGGAALQELAQSLPASPLKSALTRLAGRARDGSKDRE